MKFTEHALCFSCAGDELVGIVSTPEVPKPVGVLVLVGGPQYRVGSHRQFLLLAWALSEAGFPVMRFDYRGMGDSTGDLRDFEAVNDDIAAAIGVFRQQCPDVAKIVLWGLCDAASASLIYWDAKHDQRITGLVLLNPWVRSEASLAKTHIKHYYGQRLFQADFWRKLLSGRVGVSSALMGLLKSWRRARQTDTVKYTQVSPFQTRMMQALGVFPGEVLLILSGDDYTAKEFLEAFQADPAGARALAGDRLTRVDLEQADHTFSSPTKRIAVQDATIAWINKAWQPENRSNHRVPRILGV